MHVRVKEIPCSGKIDAQYIFHALEGGVKGVCIVTCPLGKCTLVQGNYRAEVRVRTVRRLLEEMGADPSRVEIMHYIDGESAEQLRGHINEVMRAFSAYAQTAH